MASTILEAQRSALEELERIEQAIADRVVRNPGVLPPSSSLSNSSSLHGKRKRPWRETVLQQHEISRFIKRYKEQCEFLQASYDKQAGAEAAESATRAGVVSQHPAVLRKQELASLSTTDGSNSTVLQQFYTQLGKIKEYHRRYQNEPVEDLLAQYEIGLVRARKQQKLAEEAAIMGNDEAATELASANLAKQGANVLLSATAADLDLDSIFSGEEMYGKYVDLISLHAQFLNLKFLNGSHHQQMSYLTYLDKFAEFSDSSIFPKAPRLRDPDYFKYIAELHVYLEEFFTKSNPLGKPSTVLDKIEQEFNNAWDKKIPFPGWTFDSNTNGSNSGASSAKVEDGVETANGFYCTPCGKYFAKQTVYTGHLTGKKHKKNVEASGGESASTATGNGGGEQVSEKTRLLAYHEFSVRSLREHLEKVVTDTRNNVERKRALTDRERQLEQQAIDQQDRLALGGGDDLDGDDAGNGGGSDSESGDEIVYNPLKLPLGWDGKPIPFWLWKLNGLGIEYQCEICGNYSYMGRKAFEKHFIEARHVHGLKCLGIASASAVGGTSLFKGITEIKDALVLWEKVKRDSKQDEGRKESTVEMEDEEGNVMSEKVYNDLKKQGLL